MSAARFLTDTSVLARFLRPDGDAAGWDEAAGAGLLAVCPVTELELLLSARSTDDRERIVESVEAIFGWVPVHDRAYPRAREVQEALTRRGEHRAAGPVDLVVAATAELHGLTLLHRDRDFDRVAAVTGQPVQWYGARRE